jgi:N6-adenosine-specific RNA methylase IME4
VIFAPLPPILAGAILADPPWRWRAWSQKGEGRSAVNHYDVLDLEALKALPVESVAAKDCALFLWAIDSMLPEALELVDAWGFVFKTVAFNWVKTTLAGDRFPFGCGYWTRANPEQCLLAARGKPQRLARDVPQLIVAPRGREHSRKPLEAYDRIERLVAGPYCELFARGPTRPGWTPWGDEAGLGAKAQQTPGVTTLSVTPRHFTPRRLPP